MTQTLLFLFAYRRLGLHPLAVGIALTLGAAGSVAGAAAAPTLSRRLGRERSLAVSTFCEGAAGAVLALAVLGAPVLCLAAGLAARGFFGPLWQVNALTLRQTLVPAELQARVTAAARTLGMVPSPLGALAAGALAGLLGPTTLLLIAGAIAAASVVPLLPRPTCSLRTGACDQTAG
jgi:MFS family permease